VPELPEVETVREGILPSVLRRKIQSVEERNPSLRYKIPPTFGATLLGKRVEDVERRAKYLILRLSSGDLLVHLGMSGTLRIARGVKEAEKHDHVEIGLSGGRSLVYNDPRRFGLMLWTERAEDHALLSGLGTEPLSRAFGAAQMRSIASGSHSPIKSVIMNSRMIAGVGNIYANEALFASRIVPSRPAASLSDEECGRLAKEIKSCLRRAIKAGGSTLRDFTDADKRPGYFQISHKVYGRAGMPCVSCGAKLICSRLGRRATYFCARCQR